MDTAEVRAWENSEGVSHMALGLNIISSDISLPCPSPPTLGTSQG